MEGQGIIKIKKKYCLIYWSWKNEMDINKCNWGGLLRWRSDDGSWCGSSLRTELTYIQNRYTEAMVTKLWFWEYGCYVNQQKLIVSSAFWIGNGNIFIILQIF